MTAAAPPPFTSVDEVTPEGVDAVLRSSGALHDGRVTGVSATPIGTGQMADSFRLSLTYDGPTDGPPSLVVKLPSSDPLSRSTGRTMRAYEAEVGFYRDIAGSVDVRVPRCHLAAIDPDTHDFALVLEDLSPARQGDQLEGCTAELAERVLRQAAAYHAPRWGDPALERLEWLNRTTPETAELTSTIVASLLPGFLERYGDRLDDEVVAGLERGMARIGDWWQGAGGPRGLAHGDLRLDNLLIGEGPDDLWVVDWQTLVLGNPIADVSYFVGGNLLPGHRRDVEVELVHGYHDLLGSLGVELGWDECWRLYRHGAWHGVFLTVGAAMLVTRTERGDRMFVCDLDRHVRHAIDLDALEVIAHR